MIEVFSRNPQHWAESEWKSLELYFGKLGVLECYNVIILFEDLEVMEWNGVKPRRATWTATGCFRKIHVVLLGSAPPPPSAAPRILHHAVEPLG